MTAMPSRYDRSGEAGAPPAGAPPDTFDRQPPQDLTAEQAVLGGMLLSKDAIADVVEVLRRPTSTGPRTRPSTRRSWTSTAVVSRPTR